MAARILVVDDEVDIVELVKVRLEHVGYTVLTAYNGRDCFNKAKVEKPDLILLDIIMPEVDGRETLRRLKADPETQSIPVVMLTSMGDTDSIFKAGDLGSKDYIVKPYEQEIHLSTIKKHI